MRKRAPLLLATALILAGGCTTGADPLPAGSPSASPTSAPPSPSPTPSPSASPTPDSDLPLAFPIEGSLLDGTAAAVVAKLHAVAGGLPVLKLDVTAEQATLTALLPDRSVASYAWREGSISRVDSDIQYLKQATFDPSEYPIDQVRRMFDVADLRGVHGELVLQIVQYREGQVLMTVTSRPESATVFFRQDGTAVANLGFTSVADITDGLAEVFDGATEAYAAGFNSTRGYWADLPDAQQGVVLSRGRVGGVPVFETRRTETPTLKPFDPGLIRPAALAKAIAQSQSDPTQACDVTVDMSLQRSAPVARIDCGGSVHYADMDGRDMTALVG